MMKFTWLFLINEIWINTCFQTFVQPKKISFDCLIPYTVIFSETIIILWTVTTLIVNANFFYFYMQITFAVI